MKRFAPCFEEIEPRIVLASATYEQIAGAMPLPSTNAWFSWYDTLLQARIAHSSQPRAQTFYFSQEGDDETGDGSIANPWKSLSKAQFTLLSTGGDVALLFRRGDEWNSSTGLNVPFHNVTIGAYGDPNLAKPLFSAFTIKFNAGANLWTQAAGTNRWTTSAPSRIGWIRDATSDAARLSAFTYVQSAAAVAATARSWYWDGAVLHFNPGAGVNPNLVDYEATGDVNVDGINVGGDGCLVIDIRCDGWGAVATKSYQAFGIKLSNYASSSAVVMNCEAYYNGRHGISVHGSQLDSGGFHAIVNSVTGYTNATGSGVTQFNNFMPTGQNEAIFDGVTVRFGKLPDWTLVGGGADDSPAIYGHTGANMQTLISLFIVKDARIVAEDLPGATYSTGKAYYIDRDLPGDPSDLSSLRAIFVNYQIEHDLKKSVIFGPKTVYVNSRFDLHFEGGTEMMGSISGGWFINNVFNLTDASLMRRIFHTTTVSTNGSSFLHNSFYVSGSAGIPYHQWILVHGANDQKFFAANNLFVRTGTRPFVIGAPNDPYHLAANAYVGVTKTGTEGYDKDAFLVEPSVYPLAGGVPTLASSIVGYAIHNPFGIPVEFDFFGNPRLPDAPTIGAVEFDWASVPATAAGSYYILHAGGSLALQAEGEPVEGVEYLWDVNGDGVFGDAEGFNAELSWQQIRMLGMANGLYSVRLRTIDGAVVVDSDPAVLLIRDHLPIVDAGQDQFLFAGFPLTLDASKSYAFNASDVIVFSWDVNGDGVYGDAWGKTPTLTSAEVEALGLVQNQSYSVRVRAWLESDPSVYIDSSPVILFYGPPPQADAGGPYAGLEGIPIALAALDYGAAPQYAWDLNNDGVYETFGRTTSFVAPDQGVYTVGLRLTIGEYVSTTTATIDVANRAPQVAIPPGGYPQRGSPTAITVNVTDGPADSAAGFTFDIDWDFDGTWDQTITGGAVAQFYRVFDVAGVNLFQIRATDKDGAVSATAVGYRIVNAYEVVAGTLYWYGTSGADAVAFETIDPTTIRLVETKLNGADVEHSVTLQGVTKLYAVGRDGDDSIDASLISVGPVTILGGYGVDTIRGGAGNDLLYGDVDTDGGEGGPDLIYGGPGNDTIYGDGPEGSVNGRDTIYGEDGNDVIYADGGEGAADSIFGGEGNDYIDTGPGSDFADGGNGNDILIGGSGLNGAADTLLGGDGRDILIGDIGVVPPYHGGDIGGVDSLRGGAGDDVVVAGIYKPLQFIDLLLIQLEWLSSRSYAERAANLLGTGSGGLNGTTYLIPGQNVLDDGLVDVVLGDDGQDLIIGNGNQIILE